MLYLNLETQRAGHEVGGWFPEKMGLSVATVVVGDEVKVFMEKDVTELAALLEAAEPVIGYNLERFDLQVLSGYPEFDLGKIRRFDLLQDLQRVSGQRVMLWSAVEATLGNKTDLDGANMVRCWQKGDVETVIAHCLEVTRQIKALHEFGREHGQVLFYPVKDAERRAIEVAW